MAIGPSLGELTGLIQDPNAVKYADFGLTEHEENRQKLLLQRAQLGDERAKVQLQAMLQRQAEEGRNARAQQRMGFQREKFGFEQQKFGAAEEERKRGQLEAAYAQLRDAQDRGDAAGVNYARQAIERLGATVEGGPSAAAPPPGSTTALPAPPPEAGPAPVALDSPLAALSGIPRPRAARVGVPPSEMHPGGDVTAGLATMGRNPPPPGHPPVYLDEQQGPAGGPPPQLPAATSFMAPEAGGAVTSGLAALGGRIPPPGGPPVSPEPVQLDESATQAPQAAGFVKNMPPKPPGFEDQNPAGLAALGALYYPRQPPAPAPGALATGEPSATPAATPQPAQGGLRVLQGGKPVLELGAADAPNQVRTTLQSLTANARTPEEKRSAQVAMDVALGAVQRLGVKEAIDLGLKTYEREQNNNRKTRIGTGKGVGEAGYGGTGLSKAALGVKGDADAAFRHIYDKSLQVGQMAKLNQGFQALNQLQSTAAAGTSTGDVMALKSAIKLTDERISDADFRVMAGAGGVWSTLSSKLKQFAVDADAGRIDARYMEDLKKTASAAVAALNARREQIANEVANEMLVAPEFAFGTPEEEEARRQIYAEAARNAALGRAPVRTAPSEPASKGGGPSKGGKPPAPSSGVPAKYQRLF